MANRNFQRAKANKNDEFYTQLKDIEDELRNYKDHFKNKVVYCNADDPRVSNFFHYFSYNFEYLGIKKLITTCYKNQEMDLFSMHDQESAIALVYEGEKDNGRVPTMENIGIIELEGDGDFRSPEAIKFLKEADIVVTNPPFSLFREYIAQIMEYEKKFLVIGNYGSVIYKEIFPLIKENKIWTGMSPRSMSFKTPEGDIKTVNAKWFTNLDIPKRHEELILYKKYNPEDYPKYVNFNGIEVSRVTDIPMDYEGYMGVPITFIENYNPDQFELIGHSLDLAESMDKFAEKDEYMQGGPKFYLKEQDKEYKYRRLYDRIIIKNKKVIK
ncbi:TPA: adenine-specific methyltransferase EcoRI family protein [Streptococcus suis]